MITAAVYLRVSSEMQVETGASLPSQLSAIQNYATKNGYTIPEEYIFCDEAFSARSADRPEFQRMITLAKKDKAPFNAIICYENSRFARSREDAIVYKTLLRKRGIKLLFAKQDFDDSPMGRFMEGMIEIVDEWYSANLAVETRRGQEQNAKDGYSTGGRPPYGLKRVEVQNEHGAGKARWEPDAETAPIVREIYNLYTAGGQGYKSIAAKLNRESVPSPSGGTWNSNTLHYILHKNQDAYLGRQVYGRMKSKNNDHRRDTDRTNWVIKEGAWKPIITEEMAKNAEKKARTCISNKRARSENAPRFLLTGKIFCGECGSAMTGSNAGNHKYYRCNKRCSSGVNVCSLPYCPAEELELAVVDTIRKELSNERRLKKLYADYKNSLKPDNIEQKKEIKKIESSIEKKRKEKKRIIGLLISGTIEEADAKPMLATISSDLQILEGQLSSSQEIMSSSFEFKTYDDFAQIVKDFLLFAKTEKGMIDSFVYRVDVHKENIHITLSIDTTEENIKKTSSGEDVCWVKLGVKDSMPSLTQQTIFIHLRVKTFSVKRKRH